MKPIFLIQYIHIFDKDTIHNNLLHLGTWEFHPLSSTRNSSYRDARDLHGNVIKLEKSISCALAENGSKGKLYSGTETAWLSADEGFDREAYVYVQKTSWRDTGETRINW